VVTQARPEPAESSDQLRLHPTRTSTLWSLVAVGLALALLMLIFVAQNGEPVQWEFLWMDFTLAAGLALLLAAVTGSLVVILVGAGRLFQVRLAARRHRHFDDRRNPSPPTSEAESSAGHA
jgi:uncharacterized integral membrane protein